MSARGICRDVKFAGDVVTVTLEFPSREFVLHAYVAAGEPIVLASQRQHGVPVRPIYANGRDGCGGGRD